MQAAPHTSRRRANVIVLHESRVNTVGRDRVGAKGLGEDAAMVRDPARRDQDKAVDIEALKVHHLAHH